MKLSDMKPVDQIIQDDRETDSEFRDEWDRTAFARAVAIALVRYRAERGMSQRDLSAATGMTQPAIARLETGEHLPSLGTLVNLTKSTGLEFHVDVAGGSAGLAA